MYRENQEELIGVLREQQDERRGWHAEAMTQQEVANQAHKKKTNAMIWILGLRPVIELGILIVLIVKL